MRITGGTSVAVALLVGCSDSKPSECATVGKASVAYGDLQDGASAGTATDADAAAALKVVHDQLRIVAIGGSDPDIQAAAQAASDTAGRLRVALIDRDRESVNTESSKLLAQMDAVAAPCVDQ